MEDITERQLKYLKLEYLPIPRVNVKIPNSDEYSLEPTKKQPARYLMPKLHNKQLPAFRGITACCGTTTEGIAELVFVGIRPVLNALWREEYIRIGIITDGCWITSGGTEIVEVMRGMDRKAMTPGEESLPPQHLETFDFIAMYNNIPVTCLKRVMNELLELVYTYEKTKSGWKSLYVRYAYDKDDTTPVIKGVHLV